MDGDRDFICFSTASEWSSKDVVLLAQSITDLYDIFWAHRIAEQLATSHEAALLESWQSYTKYLDRPMMYDWYREWRSLLAEWRKRRSKGPIPPPPFSFPLSWLEVRTPESLEVLENLPVYRETEDDLKIDRIILASPGGFSFAGVGEIVQQLRELVKDLWYRNQQERRKGELEIIEKYLRMRREFPDSGLLPVSAVAVEKEIVKRVQSNVKNIRTLEKDGRLLPVAENIDRRPEIEK